MDKGFYAVLGSPNSGLVMHMLDDHKHHVGLPYVEESRCSQCWRRRQPPPTLLITPARSINEPPQVRKQDFRNVP